MPYTLSPYEQRQYFDNDGHPLAAGKLATYLAGTSTAATTYSDSVGTPNTNPIILDSSGRVAAIYLDALSYKYVLYNASDVATGFTVDPVTSTAVGVTGNIGSTVVAFGGQSSSPVTVTTYPTGATFDTLHPGTAAQPIDSGDFVGTYALQATGVMDTSGTLSVALVNLSDGAPDTPLAVCTMTSLTGEVATSSAITFPAAGTAKTMGIKCKTSANTGYAWAVQLVRTA